MSLKLKHPPSILAKSLLDTVRSMTSASQKVVNPTNLFMSFAKKSVINLTRI